MNYPLMLDLENKKIVIIGGGKVAYRKVMRFLEFGGLVTVVSPHFIETFESSKEQVQLITDSYQEKYLEDSFLVVAATDDKALNTKIGMYCREKNKLCNVVSNETVSSFIVPSFLKRGELVISVSTGGNSPYLAGKIKADLEETYDESYEEYVSLLGAIRYRLLKQNLEEYEKKELLKSLVDQTLSELRAYLQQLDTDQTD
jgi:precorrin-2 dehydrogenase/sirohydrochlorin ferrochelatase